MKSLILVRHLWLPCFLLVYLDMTTYKLVVLTLWLHNPCTKSKFLFKGKARNFNKSEKRNRKTKIRLSNMLIIAFDIVIYSYLSIYQSTNLSLWKKHLTTACINIYSIHHAYISLYLLYIYIHIYIYMIVKGCHNPFFNLLIIQYFIIIH